MSDGWKTRPVVPETVAREGEPPGWYSRGYMPHFDGGEIAQTVSLRLFDSLPQTLLDQWRRELLRRPEKEIATELRKRADSYLDKGMGSAWMNRPEIAGKIHESLLHFEGVRYHLHAWVVMPNHVHALLTPAAGWELGEIMHSWKSYSASECNKLLGRKGRFWEKEVWDRYVRNEQHYSNAVAYIENNPVKAGLCERPEDWEWSSAGSARF